MTMLDPLGLMTLAKVRFLQPPKALTKPEDPVQQEEDDQPQPVMLVTKEAQPGGYMSISSVKCSSISEGGQSGLTLVEFLIQAAQA